VVRNKKKEFKEFEELQEFKEGARLTWAAVAALLDSGSYSRTPRTP
jgi:hypothetical protein